MEKQDAGPSLRLESCFQHMDRETVDVINNAVTDAGWQRGIAVGWKVADIQADDGRAGRALGERESANRRGRGCQTKSPPDKVGRANANRLDAEMRSRSIRHVDHASPSQQPLRGTNLPVRRTCCESLYLSGDVDSCAQSGGPAMSALAPLLGAKRTQPRSD
jgi:hypothetical protein